MRSHPGAALVGRISRSLPARRWQVAHWLSKVFVPRRPFIGRFHTGQIEVHPGEVASMAAFYNGFYERVVTMWCLERLRTEPPELLIDVGANFGYYPLLFGLLSGGKVKSIAFEPEPNNFNWLTRNLELNPHLQISAVQKIVAAEPGLQLPFEMAKHGQQLFARVSGSCIKAQPHDGIVQVSSTTVDLHFETQKIERASLVMIDVEGYELEVLKGMTRTLTERRVSTVIVEFHPWAFANPVESLNGIVSRFSSAGYRGLRFRDHDLPTSDKDPAFFRLNWDPSLLEPLDVQRRSNWEHYLFTLDA